ncbi:MAG: phosphoenolpyruvate synthase [archaeon]
MVSYAETIVERFMNINKNAPAKKKIEDIGEDKFVKWLSELSKESIPIAGGKGANLGEMFNAKMPVPPAFVITAQAYNYFLDATNLKERIKAIIDTIDVNSTADLEEKAKLIREIIKAAQLPSELKEEIVEAYSNLNADPEALKSASGDALNIMRVSKESCFVAVRSSATTEDLAGASFAGQQETFLNIKGNEQLLDAVRKCFASLFTARAVYYRVKKGFDHEKSLIAVVVQKMINSDKSGVMFTVNPLDDKNEVVIEGVFGLGEGIVSGTIMPDHYVINKETIQITQKSLGTKDTYYTRSGEGKTLILPVPPLRRKDQVLTDSEIKQVANQGIEIESHYGHPQDIEFAIEGGRIFIVQSRPITTIGNKKDSKDLVGIPILEGLAASPGIASGQVKIVKGMEELSKVEDGDVLVTKMTNPDMVMTMQKACAIVTDEGGATAHAAIVSREMGIPCVVGTKKATTLLKDGQIVTVDGFKGKVYDGELVHEKISVEILPIVETKTKIKVLVDLPAFAERAMKTNAYGIGLIRLEGIIASANKHPVQYINEGKSKDYEELIFTGLNEIAKHFVGKPIWVRTSDIRTDEFQDLKGSPKVECNPMLGLHGIRFSLKNKELFNAELRAIKRVADGGAKMGIMLPQVISLEEVKQTKLMVNAIGMNHVDFGVMIETPAAVQIIEDLCKEISFISFGTNDLTQYTLAVDRGNGGIQDLYNEMHPAVLSQLSYVIKACKKYGVESSICGQAGSNSEMAKFLVKEGIDSISVNADVANEISKVVAETEKSLQVQQQSSPVVQQPPIQQKPQQLPRPEYEEQEEEAIKSIMEKEDDDMDIHEMSAEEMGEEDEYSGRAKF